MTRVYIGIHLLNIAAATAWAQPTRGHAWALVTGGASPSVSALNQFNSAGGAITVSRATAGQYSVAIPNMGNSGGTAHAAAYNGNHYCNVGQWNQAGTSLVVDVGCFNAAGAAADGAFTVLYYKENRASAQWNDGFLLADSPSLSGYVPTLNYGWNSRGAGLSIARSGTGRYRATFAGLTQQPNLGTALVTANGPGNNARCRVDLLPFTATVTLDVACDTPAGAPADSRFTLAFLTDTAFGVNGGEDQRRGSFVFANDASSASYVPDLRYQTNAAGGPVRARRTAVGAYELDIPAISANGSVQVSRFGSAGYCNVEQWLAGPLNGATVRIKCYTTAGAAGDAQFLATYLTSELATSALPAASAPARAKGWVWSDGTATNSAPNSAFQFNSSGGANSITRYAPGSYRADLPGLGTLSGIVHVNSYGGSAYCKANTWGPNGTTLEVWVMCLDSAGVAVDNQFSVLFYKESRNAATWNAGYARVQMPITGATYAPASNYAWNGLAQPMSVNRTATGTYTVAFNGLSQPVNAGSILVTPYGVNSVRCKVTGWAGNETYVFCHLPDGTAADSEFGVSNFTDVLFGSDSQANAHPGAFAWSDQSGTASYTPEPYYSFNSAGGSIQGTRTAAGTYRIEFSGLKAYGKSMPMVTAFGTTGGEVTAFCAPTGWTAKSGTPGTAITIKCLDRFGAAVDSRFTITYLTSPTTPALTYISGSRQSTTVNTAFSAPLRVSVNDANLPLAGTAVSFSAPGSGASATFAGGGSAVTDSSGAAQVSPSANATGGGYTVTAATSGGANTVEYLLTNQPASGLQVPVFTSPLHGAAFTNTIVGFGWTAVPGATKYELRVIEAATPQQFRVEVIGATSAIYTLPSGNYRAEIRACDNSGCGPVGLTVFTLGGSTVPTTAPSGLSCSVTNESNQNRLNCTWSPLAGAHFYFVHVVQPGAGPGGGALTVAGRQVGAATISTLVPNGNASVLVRACTGDGCGPLTSGFAISPSFGNPTVPILGEPFAGSSVNSGSNAPQTFFAWNRVAGDNGSNYRYRLYVQDFSRNAAALDVLTSANYYSAFLNPGTRYDALVIAMPVGGGASLQGPPNGFLTRGRVPRSPVATSPALGSTVQRDPQGLVQVSWTPLVNNDGTAATRNYQYFLNGPTQLGGVTTATTAFLNLAPGAWQAIMRVCTTGTTCTAGSPAGWGPWNNEAGSEGGMTSFTVQ